MYDVYSVLVYSALTVMYMYHSHCEASSIYIVDVCVCVCVLFCQHEEQTVASLETKMSQLSEAVGSYVQLREQDQTTMQLASPLSLLQ